MFLAIIVFGHGLETKDRLPSLLVIVFAQEKINTICMVYFSFFLIYSNVPYIHRQARYCFTDNVSNVSK